MLIPAVSVFVACSLLAMGLELFRLRLRPGAWVRTELCALGIGVAAQTVYLGLRTVQSERLPLSSPRDALMVLVWVLTGISMGLISTHRNKNFGLFLLPMILILLLVSFLASGDVTFAERPASTVWGIVHGISMLLAAVSIFCGFLSGTIYLRQIWNLKHPVHSSFLGASFRLPSLEWLHYANRHSMKLAAVMLALGVLSGIVMDLRSHNAENLLSNQMILGTTGLLLWFVFSLVLGFFWKRANAGPQIAYRTILNFVALCTLFGLVIFSQHRILPRAETPPAENVLIVNPKTVPDAAPETEAK